MGLYSGGRIYKAAYIWNVDYIRADWKRRGGGGGGWLIYGGDFMVYNDVTK